MKHLYWQLDRLGRVRLSQHFYMRQFLYSEIGVSYGIPNVPDNPDLAIETGTKLCTEILEPLMAHFGPIVVRSGFRSAKLNAFGSKNKLGCAANEKNFAYHIWDHLDANGHIGAAACVVIPGVVDLPEGTDGQRVIADWAQTNLNFHRLTFFKRDFAFNIGWHESKTLPIWDQ